MQNLNDFIKIYRLRDKSVHSAIRRSFSVLVEGVCGHRDVLCGLFQSAVVLDKLREYRFNSIIFPHELNVFILKHCAEIGGFAERCNLENLVVTYFLSVLHYLEKRVFALIIRGQRNVVPLEQRSVDNK